MSVKDRKHGAFPFVLAGISFIPLIGVLFGVICIAIALIARKSNSLLLGILGGSGILFTVVIYGVILPFALGPLWEGKFSSQFEPFAKGTMKSMIRHVEYYKLQNSRYPDSIEELRATLENGEMRFTGDVSGPLQPGRKLREFYYEVLEGGDHYLLFGVGLDGIPFTEDDIFPVIDPVQDKAIGWLKNR